MAGCERMRGSSGDGPTSAAAGTLNATTRVVVVSKSQLIRDAVRTALRSLGFTAASIGLPTGANQFHEVRRWLAGAGPVTGLLLTSLDDAAQMREAVGVVSGLDLDWLLLTSTPPGPSWGAVLDAGARDIMSTSTSLEDLSACVRAISDGRDPMPNDEREESLAAWRRVAGEHRRLTRKLEALSPREMEILLELREGDSVKVIASRAGVSEGTVRSQVKSLLRKLGVSSQLQAVATYRHVNEWFSEQPVATRDVV